ncbi:type I restriction enzyme, S subunit [Spiroplasma helicoides]|uniref:Type I restriction enzyme, S subunit n=1 Tax=Spiroplasma helicoides TaxID=216938 RepID=A0A1B3SKD1_9MOLU|nr:restriction endonuclease subunit S [Spiroplasma helicoides]AOG60385.1 type I restriction enzyme, S subunit [Spiroplasma helicoides]
MAIYKLEDLVIYKRGESDKGFSKFKAQGLYPIVSAGVNIKGYINKYNRDELIPSISSSGANAGHITIINEKYFAADCFSLLPITEKIKLKYLNFILIKNKDYIKKQKKGSAQPHVYYKDIKDLELEIPNLIEQQKIIDIIEQNEKIFLKYPETVRIDNLNNCQSDINALIDIIEPLENLRNKIFEINKKVISIISNIGLFIVDEKGGKVTINKQKEISYKEGNYIQTADIGDFNNKIKKIHYNMNPLPSRARLNFLNKTLYISKLLGEKKFLYSEHVKSTFIVSNGMWGININDDFKYSIYSFFLSDKFYELKKVYSTGTTMVGLNDKNLLKILSGIKITKDKDIEASLIYLFYLLSNISYQLIKVDKLIKNFLNLLIK